MHPSSSHLTPRNDSIVIFILEMRKLKHRKLIDLPVVSQLGSKLSEHSAARRKLASASASFLSRTQVWFRAWTPLGTDLGSDPGRSPDEQPRRPHFVL